MTRMRRISLPRPAEIEKQDLAGAVFFQIWLSVFGAILGTAFKRD